MSNIRPVTIAPNPFSSWQNLVQRTVQSQNVIAGSGVRAGLRTTDFTELVVNQDVDMDHLRWAGDFDPTAEYFLNDVIRVLPDQKYVNPKTGGQFPIGSTAEEGHAYAPLSMGLFVCVKHIPPSWSTPTYFTNTIFPTYPYVVPYTWTDGVRWDQNVYYPIAPEIPTNYTRSIDPGGYGFNITANENHWKSMLPFGVRAFTTCTNGQTETTYVMAYISGSAFRSEYLPYTIS